MSDWMEKNVRTETIDRYQCFIFGWLCFPRRCGERASVFGFQVRHPEMFCLL